MSLCSTIFSLSALAAPRVQTSPFELPEITLSVDTVTRASFTSTASLAALVNLKRTRRADLEAGVGVVVPSTYLFQPGFQRQIWSIDGVVDALYTPSTFLAVGPSVALSVRTYTQQFWWVSTRLVPQAGARIKLHLLHARNWRLGLQSRLMVDLLSTDLVIGTATIRELPPVALTGGLYFSFGHDRVPAPVSPTSLPREGV